MIGKRTSKDILIYITLLVVVLTTAIFNHNVIAQTETEQKLTTELSGVNEVPPTNSSSTGLAEFEIEGTDSIRYHVNASNIQDVTAGHLHGGLEGENGPIVVQLFSYDTPRNHVSESGIITAGNSSFQGSTTTSQQQLKDFMDAMRTGQVYVNIHTEQNPDGEIRGQITTN
jgi:CHRD domain-containing protein